MRMKKLMGSFIATVMAMGMIGGVSANAAYKPNLMVAEWDYNKIGVSLENADSIGKGCYNIHYSIDDHNIIYLNLNNVEGTFGICWNKIFSITTPSNYAISDSKIGEYHANENKLGYNKIMNGDGTTTWELALFTAKSATVVLCPIGTNDTENEITFKGWNDEPLNTYIITDPYESYINEIETLKSIINSQKNRAYGDMNDDGFVDARDASLLLTLYARQSVGDPITLEQLIEEQKGQ